MTTKFVVTRYNHDMTQLLPYLGDDYILYDRSEESLPNSIKMPNIGSDIYDKFTWIIDNYDNLPDVIYLLKANLFKYITVEEWEKVKDNRTFTPLLTQHHKTELPISYYKDGLYNEINNYWYLVPHPAKYTKEIRELFNMDNREYNEFAPGSNYIVTREVIHRHPKELYVKLRSYLDWEVYPGDAQLIERNLYYLWSMM